MSGLRTISAVFAAAAGLDAEQTAPLHFFGTPMVKMNSAALRNQLEQWLVVEILEFPKRHRVPATLNPKSEIRNPKFS